MEPASAQADNAGTLQRRASYASLTVALILIGTKVWAWYATSSVSVLSSLVDSLLDLLASGITVIAVMVALKPPDSEHRFGHGKTEGLAAFMQSLIISISALFVLNEAVQRLLNPQPVTAPAIGMGVMLLSICLTLLLVLYQRSVVNRTGSVAIAADAMHYRSDLLVNVGVLLALPISAWTQWAVVDPILGITIALYILWTTLSIASDATGVLLDRELPLEERQRIEHIARKNPHVRGFHDLRTRSGGTHYIIQFHLELDPETTLLKTHRILDDVEDDIRNAYPDCEIIVHADPLGFEEPRDEFE
jgi:ferrous-iron efflux pump FieF